MKKQLLSFGFVICSALFSVAQTATNFTTNDCDGNNHDLFTELNAGKVVVITWVMPCGACINGATAAQNAVLSFSASNPGQVVHYVADDVANTSCGTLASWCTTNGVAPDAKFSSSSVNMSGYGTAGMPKVVVLGGTSHTVYYNVNGSSITLSGIQSAITNALAVTGINETSSHTFQTKISPNPATNELMVTFNAKGTDEITVEIYNVIGQKVKAVKNTSVNGKNEIKINTEDLNNGSYFAKIAANGKTSDTVKFLIVR